MEAEIDFSLDFKHPGYHTRDIEIKSEPFKANSF